MSDFRDGREDDCGVRDDAHDDARVEDHLDLAALSVYSCSQRGVFRIWT